jgi:DNA repair exonuclease SbcCD nuclease subunit
MKIAIITDTHFGARKNSKYFMQVQKEFYENTFFPYLLENNIDTIFHLGDFFDNRTSVNFAVLRHADQCFVKPIINNGMTLHLLMGNHDSHYKTTGELVNTKLLFEDIANVKVYDTMEEFTIDGVRFLMVPWIFPDQEKEMVEEISLCPADVCCGHFEMLGVVQEGNNVSRSGIETGIFSHFSHVFSGHFHKPSEYYVGSPYQTKWSEVEDNKRFIVFDTKDQSAVSVYNPERVFYEIDYPADVDTIDPNDYHGKIVRVHVKTKDDIAQYELFIKALESAGVHVIDIKEEYLYVDVIQKYELEDSTDTLSILKSTINQNADLSDGDKLVMCSLVEKLYKKAQN